MLVTECDSEQAAAKVLGYDEASWENLSGEVRTPLQARLPWAQLIFVQKKAAKLLGYNKGTWSTGAQTESSKKQWSELTTCGECKIVCIFRFLALSS